METHKNEKTIQRNIDIVREVEAFLKEKCNAEDFSQIKLSDLQRVVQYFLRIRKTHGKIILLF